MSVEEIKIDGFEANLENMEMLLGSIKDDDGEDYYKIAKDLKYGYEFLINGWSLEQEEEHGGEGQGDDYWVVVKASKDDQVYYWKFYGWYASHGGGYLENVEEVKPVEKLVTVWE